MRAQIEAFLHRVLISEEDALYNYFMFVVRRIEVGVQVGVGFGARGGFRVWGSEDCAWCFLHVEELVEGA